MRSMVLLPTYNEIENIQIIIPAIFESLKDASVMVIDDNSPDGTANMVREMQKKYPNLILFQREKKSGLGRAYTDAFQKVLKEFPDFDVVYTMDADLSHDPAALPHMLKAVETNDFVIGSRYVSGGKLDGWELSRRLLSLFGNRYCRLITRLPINDCTSGFGCIRTSVLRKLNFEELEPSGYAFLIALKHAIFKQNASIIEHPITFRSRLSGESKISINIIQEGLLLPWRLKLKKNKIKKKVVGCPLCKQNGIFWFTKNDCEVYKCTTCALIFVPKVPNTIDKIYSKDYFCGAHDGFGYIDYDAEKKSDLSAFNNYLEEIEKNVPRKGTLLDVGAATGAFLDVAKNRDWNVIGIEISDFAASQARAKGLNVYTGTLDSTNIEDNSIDVITLWDVFEHIIDAETTLKIIYRILKPGGLLVLNTPDAKSIYASIMGKHWALIIPPEHVRLYSEQNLKTLLKKNNFSWMTKKRIGKVYQLAYIFQILYTTRKQKVWKGLSNWIRKTPLNRLRIPIHLRDNMFIIANKN